MTVLDAAIMKTTELFQAYARRLVEGLTPVLARLDAAKLDARSAADTVLA